MATDGEPPIESFKRAVASCFRAMADEADAREAAILALVGGKL